MFIKKAYTLHVMITKKLQTLFLISIPVFIAHGLEEYFTGLYNVDATFYFMFQYLQNMSILQAAFILFQIMIWLILIISYLILIQGKSLLCLMTFLGFVFIFELQHVVKTVLTLAYYPGTITSLLFPVIGFYFWKELIRSWKQNKN